MNVTPLATASAVPTAAAGVMAGFGIGPVPLPQYAVRGRARAPVVAAAPAVAAVAAVAAAANTFQAVPASPTSLLMSEEEFQFAFDGALASAAVKFGCGGNNNGTSSFVVDDQSAELMKFMAVNPDEIMGEEFALSPGAFAMSPGAIATAVEAAATTTTTTTTTTTAASSPSAAASVEDESEEQHDAGPVRPKRKRNRKTEAQTKKERRERETALYAQTRAGRDAINEVVPGLNELLPLIKLLADKYGWL